MHTTFNRLGEMVKRDYADTCGEQFPLMSMEWRATHQVCTEGEWKPPLVESSWRQNSQILISIGYNSTDVSLNADLGGNINFSAFVIYTCIYRFISLQAREILQLTVLECFLENYLFITILAVRVSYIYMYPLKLVREFVSSSKHIK